jgi:hypothetical protein
MRRLAEVIRRNGRIVVASYSKTTPGFSVLNSWQAAYPDSILPEELGKAVMAALAASREDVPPPPPRQSSPSPELKALMTSAGVKSYSAFMNGARSVDVRQENRSNVITVTPMRNCGPREGFDFLPDLALELPATSSEHEIGQAILYRS